MGFSATWVAGQAIPMTQFRPFCCLELSAKKSIDFSFVVGWKGSLQSKLSITSNMNRKNLAVCCRCSGDGSDSSDICSSSSSSSSSLDWDWNQWSRHFSEIEQAESFASVLKFQLEDAIEKEDFQEASKLKMAIAEATFKDCVAEIMSELKTAIEEERYHDASKLCKYTGSGLDTRKTQTNPFGRLIRITPGVGRFIARSYSPRQLITASPGNPLFEIFVVKDDDKSYVMQVISKFSIYLIVWYIGYVWRSFEMNFARVIYARFLDLRTPGSVLAAFQGNSTSSTYSPAKFAKSPSTTEVENGAAVDIEENEEKTERSEEKGINLEGATEEGIKSVINFLKDKIPGLKVKVMNVNISEEVVEDADTVNQIMHEDNEKSGSDEISDDEIENLDEIQPDAVTLGDGSDTIEDGKELDMKLFIGGVVHNNEDTPTKDEYVRLPAEINEVDKDSFVLHIPGRSVDLDSGEKKVSKVKVAAIAAQGVSELMPPEVAKAFWGADKVSSKVSKNVREIVKLAVSQAQKRSRLSEHTTFSRIPISKGDLDPFNGLYVGAFGPYGTEVVQLRRKFGHWNDAGDQDTSSDIEFFEYVEAVKLTGDLNVPAGQVTFRAKIGRGNRTANRGIYPDELGVVANFRGQGRIAEFGFKNPQWVDGELLQLNGKGIGPYVKGADLGFLYVVPEQSFLVLFNRLKLPD